MWKIIGWTIWSIITFLAIWGVYSWRKKVESGEEFDWTPYSITLSFWVISILFLIFDWHKLHLLWIVPIAFMTISSAVLNQTPIVSSILLFAIQLFQKIALVGVKTPYQKVRYPEHEIDEKDK